MQMDSIRSSLTPDSLAATIKMLRTSHRGSFLLVEGDTDARAFKKIVVAECIVQPCHDRDKLFGVVKILNTDDFAGFVAIADRDFDWATPALSADNLLYTDLNDFELMVIATSCFDVFLIEYANAEKLGAIEGATGKSIRDVVVSVAQVIGALRVLSRKNGWALSFKRPKIKFAPRDTFDLEVERLIAAALGTGNRAVLPSDAEVGKLVKALIAEVSDPWKLSSGHDVCEIIAHGVHNVFGRAHVLLERTGEAIEEALRLCFSFAAFRETRLFKLLRDWQDQNANYSVLS